MAYEFEPGAAAGKSVRRVAAQQAQKLRDHLTLELGAASGFHDARKCVKRLRSLLVLARPALGKRDWRKLDHQIRDIGRRLSSPREAAALQATIGRLRGHIAASALTKLNDLRIQPAVDTASSVDLGAIADDAEALMRRLKALKLRDLTWNDMLRVVTQDYKAGRKCIAPAYASEDAERFHELRKHLQRHARHLQLFAGAWPDEFSVRSKLAKSAGEVIGLDHDIAMLRDRLRNGAGELLDGRTMDELDGRCRQQQRALRAQAKPLLARLYAEMPRALNRRLRAYWSAEPMPESEPSASTKTVPEVKRTMPSPRPVGGEGGRSRWLTAAAERPRAKGVRPGKT